MTDDLERDLRRMLTTRAGDIRTVPAGVLASADPDEVSADVVDLATRMPSGGRRRWPLLVAAAVVLAALAGVLTVVFDGSGHRDTPSLHRATTTITRSACRARVPSSWTAPLAAATRSVPSLGNGVVAVTSDGGAVVEAPPTTDPTGFRYRIGFLAPSATTVHWLTTLATVIPTGTSPAGATMRSGGLDVDTTGDVAVVTIESGGRFTMPQQVVAIDLHTGARTVLASTSSAAVIEHQAYALDGVAYWEAEVRAADGSRVDTINARPVTGGETTRVASGAQYDLQKSALGIEWNLDDGPIDRPAIVPALVAAHAALDSRTGDVFGNYVSNGRVYAWQTLDGALDWYDASSRRLVRVPNLLGKPGVAPGQAALFAVSGPLVYFQNADGTGDEIIDVRTAAVLPVDNTGMLFAAAGRLVGDPSVFGIASVAGAGNLISVRGGRLPTVHC